MKMELTNKRNDEDEERREVDVSEIMERTGPYQYYQYLFVCLPAAFIGMICLNYVFVAGDINYRCRVPKCEGNNSTLLPIWWPNSDVDRCSKPVLNETLYSETLTCSNVSFTSAVEQCSEWIYESNDTIVAELNLGCQPWKINMVGTINSLGSVVSMIVAGWMCDRFGRKPTLIICSVGCLVGNLKTFATTYNVYLALEFFDAVISGGINTATVVLIIEIGSKKHRALSGVLFAYAIYMGEAIFPIIAKFVPYWKDLVRVICSPTILFLSYIFLLQESPRWLIVNGKISAAKKTFKLMAKINKLKIKDIDEVNEEKLKDVFNIDDEGEKEGFKKAMKSVEIVKRLIVAFICRFSASYIYYSLIINSVWLPGDKYVNFFLSALMSFPGELITLYFMNKIGRKLPLIYGFLICGICCFASGLVPEYYKWLKILLFMIAKLLVSSSYTGILTYTMELFPTSVRGTMLGICTFASCAGGMLAPLTPTLATISTLLAPISFGSLAVMNSALLTMTPETKNLPLMDTIDQITNSSKDPGNIEIKEIEIDNGKGVIHKNT